jgi:hypothetical protein
MRHVLLVVLLIASSSTSGREGPRLVRLQDGEGWRVLTPWRAWGTPLLVQRLAGALTDVHHRFPRAPVIWVHDISKRRGGSLRLHRSHRDGRDADIRLPQRVRAGYVDATPRTLDVERTWHLIVSLIATCDVEFIVLDHRLQGTIYRHARRRGVSRQALALILQFPRRISFRHPKNSVVRHYPRHRNHMHVRFRREGEPLSVQSATALCAVRGRSRPLIHHAVLSLR